MNVWGKIKLVTPAEVIGFKGYILSKNSESPNVNTTNINLVIYVSNNKVVKKREQCL